MAYASRALTPTECNYAQIEKELLAIVFGMTRFDTYVYGRRVVVETDHKPLEAIHSKSLLNAPKRLQRMLLALQRYDIELIYKKGVDMVIADPLSRAYLSGEAEDQNEVVAEVEAINLVKHLPMSAKRLQDIKKAAAQDKEQAVLRKVIMAGWPDSRDGVPEVVLPYYNFRDELVVFDGLIFKGERLVIPAAMRPEILDITHGGHMGVQSCLRRAREAIFWPGLNADINDVVEQCEICQERSRAQPKEPLINHPLPERPWQMVGCDLFDQDGQNYIVTVDYYSDFFEVDRLYSTAATSVIHKLKTHFARYGIPNTVMSDGGPPFDSRAMTAFAEHYGFDHKFSSPGFPQSNGKVESAVKIAKSLMSKAKADGRDVFLSLLEYRNTPTEGIGVSPAQRLMQRRTRTLLPTTSSMLEPRTPGGVKDKLDTRRAKQKSYHDRHSHALAPLSPGEVVRINPRERRKPWKKAIVLSKHQAPRSYIVETENGGVYRRNRRHLKQTREQPPIQRPLVDLPRSDTGHGASQLTTANSAVARPPDLTRSAPEPRAPAPVQVNVPQSAPVVTEEHIPPTPITPKTMPRRSERQRTQPARFRDYVCYK